MPTPYLDFLKDLSANNSKEWMDTNRDRYLNIKEAFLRDVAVLLEGVTAWEPALAAFKPKDCVFRQNRDIRFSANKAPYKTNFAAYFSKGGKKSNGPGYYLHIQPGESFIAGGIWMPSADILKKIRQEIDYSGQELLNILNEKTFKNHFSGIEGEQLKTSPRDYDAEHPFIDLLRYKSFIVSTPLADKDILSGDFKAKTLESFHLMKPFHDFLHKAADESESGEGLL
ncbi:DUF2461 domain-containing protein [Belliella sp. DSM 107340]|uniref:DUF2461 domain-containing protein n=1 Tax=Belliella calami TaxID=2923436 RepID=A0ABS9UTN9_9BACT|nr:DUF2461 domain-containing protein [Belliella calami]MCH7399986.1 DUF2461 domain-containing protein [Belliella calami]